MARLALLGAGDLARSLRGYVDERGEDSIVGCFDDARRKGESFEGLEVLGAAADAPALFKRGAFERIVFAIGYRSFAARSGQFARLREQGVAMHRVVHATAYVHPTARLGEGVHLFPGTLVDLGVALGDNVLLNTGCIVAHHSTVGAHSYFGPGAKVSGLTEVGERCFIGIGATIIEKLRIGAGSTIAAGAVVIDDVAPGSLMAGVPATLKKRLE